MPPILTSGLEVVRVLEVSLGSVTGDLSAGSLLHHSGPFWPVSLVLEVSFQLGVWVRVRDSLSLLLLICGHQSHGAWMLFLEPTPYSPKLTNFWVAGGQDTVGP